MAFGEYVQEMLVCLIRMVSSTDSSSKLLRESVENLRSALSEISRDIKDHQSMSKTRRFMLFSKEAEVLIDLRRRFDEALNIFQVEYSIKTEWHLNDILEHLQVENISKMVQDVNEMLVNQLAYNASLEHLPYVKGASWNRNRGCLAGTRGELLSEIVTWTMSATESADILLLSGVAGSGKTAIAHSVAERAFENGSLLTSFFFNREDSTLNNPTGLITTLARDISRQSKSLSLAIGMAVGTDPGLPVAHSLSLQFQKLVIEPLEQYPNQASLVVVIDALDEGYNEDLLRILRDEVPKIPAPIHFFITSRPASTVTPFLSPNLQHVQQASIDVHSESNKADIGLFVRHGLQDIARDLALNGRHDGDTEDVDSQLSSEVNAIRLAQKADGLFIWASTVIKHLSTVILPETVLLSILLEKPTSNNTVPSRYKIDKLYLDILSVFNWEDTSFVEGYQLVMGTMVVALEPISISALLSIHSSSRISARMMERAIARLGSLLVIPTNPKCPVHLIHLSLREFITTNATRPLFVDEKEHHRRLVPLLFQTLNRGFAQHSKVPGRNDKFRSESIPEDIDNDIPPISFDNITEWEDALDSIPDIPLTSFNNMSEEFWYACRFWSDHLAYLELPLPDGVLSHVQEFLQLHFESWTEAVVSLSRYRPLGDQIMRVATDLKLASNTLGTLLNTHQKLKEADRVQEERLCSSDINALSSIADRQIHNTRSD
ncbi:hypothetical protein L218DRAFT_430446 [Marasmius fiardii PR-910]|nr:hypothetical protein L218DRAFT_430446 [Marasmius fiardii PR-910]